MGQLQIIKASAGSGKTYRLTLEYIRNLIISPESYRNILAVTFTNKATSEMKERILRELYTLAHHFEGEKSPFYDEFASDERIDGSKIVENAAKALSYILHDYSRFSVLTIDKFFQKIIRAFVKELGLEGGYNIKFDNDYIVEMAVDRLVDKSKYDEELWSIIESIIAGNIDSGKAAGIKREVVKLSQKIADENFNAADDHAKDQFEAIEVIYNSTISEIRQKASEVALLAKEYNDQKKLPGKSRSFYSNIEKISKGETVEYNKTTQSTAQGEKKWEKGVDESVKEAIILELYNLIEMIDRSELIRNTCMAVLKNYRPFLLLNRINDEIVDINRESGSMMLSHSMRILTTLINENDAPFIYEKIGTTFSRFMIDEFQDTSTSQWQNFVPLLNNALSSGEGTTVTLLGDVKQSIYGWRGGNWRLLGGDLTVDIYNQEQIAPPMSLTTNWRSEPNVIDFNNRFMARFIENLSLKLNNDIDRAYEEGYIDNAYRDKNHNILSTAYDDLFQEVSSKAKEGRGYVSIEYYDKEGDGNLLSMIQTIEDAQKRGYRAGDIAILVRGKKEASAVADYIIKYRTENRDKNRGICYDFVSSDALKLSYSDSIRLIVAIMRASQTPDLKEGNVETLMINSLRSGEYGKVLSDDDYHFISSLRYHPLTQCFEKIVSYYSLDSDETIVSYIQAFHQKLVTFASDESSDIGQFLEWWDSEGVNSAIYMPQSLNTMLITTIHASKGLEFKVVILPFARQKLDPHTNSSFWASTDQEPFDQLENVVVNYSESLSKSYFAKAYHDYKLMTYIESTNVLYVALTRSRDELYLMLTKKEKDGDSFDAAIEALVAENIVEYRGDDNMVAQKFEKGSKSTIENEINSNVSDSMSLTSYKSNDYTQRLKIRQSTRRYYEESDDKYLSPRHYGVIMHKLFERIESSDDVEKALKEMVSEGIISAEDSTSTMDAIKIAFSNPMIKDWFDSRWEVKAENDILMPMGSGGRFSTYRPDRVLIDGDSSIVIDYKFGSEHSKHNKQVAHYKELLKSMGYRDVKGYVWYVIHNKIVEV